MTNITVNSTATYSCNDGYNLVGDTTRTCLTSGSWSGVEPACIGNSFHTQEIDNLRQLFFAVVNCDGLTDPENGTVTLPGTTFNSTATYSCNDGYNLVGDTTRTCLASGSWSDTAPTCTGGVSYPSIVEKNLEYIISL